jgi:hypothetical protein
LVRSNEEGFRAYGSEPLYFDDVLEVLSSEELVEKLLSLVLVNCEPAA